MSCLDKLAIRGIRSFDDKQISVIEFFSPVTVIIGPNGSGKTTIIECLKYATTGDQPPNTRGGAFVHDPKMANEKEVKAQVKLRFFAANGKRMLAVRNLSVTMKKTAGMTMKTLESILALADGDGGKRTAISTKCAEMDTEIPHLLGVSKAVLENVIFCHQEESYWPLAEPAALKKKFDDIFEATRYTKALDSIKSLRKDRVAELKAEKERLESLSREKSHADKLKSRISDLNATIAAREVEFDETKHLYEQLALANAKFYDSSSKFREIYVKVESLIKEKQRYEEDLAELKSGVQEVTVTDQELSQQISDFDKNLGRRKQARREQQSKLQDFEEDLAGTRKAHVALVDEHGQLAAEAKAQENRIAQREALIRQIATQHTIRGYEASPLSRDQIADFVAQLGSLQSQQADETDRIQAQIRDENKTYNTKYREMTSELAKLQQQRADAKDRSSKLQSDILSAETKVEQSQMLDSELETLVSDVEEKKNRIEKTKSDIAGANYEARHSELNARSRELEDKRETLNSELQTLSLEADTRARLNLKRDELKAKGNELKSILQISSTKYRKFVHGDPDPLTMEKEIDRLLVEKEKEQTVAEAESASADRKLGEAESTTSSLRARLRIQKEEFKKLDKQIRTVMDGLEHESVEAAMAETLVNISGLQTTLGTLGGAKQLWEALLFAGQNQHLCKACNRHIEDKEMAAFEMHLRDQIQRSTEKRDEAAEGDLKDCEAELKILQELVPVEASRNRLRDSDIPELEKQIAGHEASITPFANAADKTSEKLNAIKKDVKDLTTLRQHALSVTRLHNDTQRLTQEIKQIEEDLTATGSTKTADDVKEELDKLSLELRAVDKEKQTLMSDRERRNNALRTYQNELHSMQLREQEVKNQLKEKASLERAIRTMQDDIVNLGTRAKELDAQILESQAPIGILEREHKKIDDELNEKFSRAQTASQELNMSIDRLEDASRAIDKYVRDKRARKLTDCAAKIEEYQTRIQDLMMEVEGVRKLIAQIDKEVGEANASLANLRDNLRVRKLAREIAQTQEQIDSFDMEEAARARRNFDEKWHLEKQKETELQSKNAHIGGELKSCREQLKTLERDMRDFKDVNKKYTDQLVKVKMSDMANNDLEKYAKALDNAIMKYHSMKMEEVNDTMRHLWNKTYQGTDIDGIKIRSDSEGGASKRSYNYRVVMTKDQVEMDMRGRCSAGQKMLASIIIRLALSDSFGQNCGILALDEPTNALDMDNIDALAASLVDIINERKSHANFQLIIITHDENFLRKLGQSDVMEYYWRVSRDSRQKSVIERQRFG